MGNLVPEGLSFQVGGSLKFETINTAVCSLELRSENVCASEDQQQLLTIDPSSHQRGNPHLKNRICLSNKNLVMGPRWVSDTKTDRPTDRNS
jgi:hypothetical protein